MSTSTDIRSNLGTISGLGFRDAQGRPVAVVPSPAGVADLGWPAIRAVNESLAIDADTIACEWDGTPVDYGTIVGHLATVDGLR